MMAVAVAVGMEGEAISPSVQKLQKPYVKREVASANSNIVRDLSSYHSPLCCVYCQRERTKAARSNRYKKQKQHHQSRANAPIVIKLKDTLEAALRHKLLNSDNSGRKYVAPDIDRQNDRARSNTAQTVKKHAVKNEKNLNVLLTAFEKDNSKHNGNLDSPTPAESKAAKKHNNVLNNFTCTTQNKEDTDNMKHTNILIGRNRYVDVICNDLKSSSERDTESPDDSEIDNTSVLSSTDSEHSLGSDTSKACETHQKGGLETLAQYATGFSLIRYDCSPTECPQCAQQIYMDPRRYAAVPHSPTNHSPIAHSRPTHSRILHPRIPHPRITHTPTIHSAIPHPFISRAAVARATHSAIAHNQVPHSPVGHSPVGHSPVGHSPVGHSPVGHSTVRHSPVGHSAMRHSPVARSPGPHSPTYASSHYAFPTFQPQHVAPHTTFIPPTYQYDSYYSGDSFIEIEPHLGSSHPDLRDRPRPVSQRSKPRIITESQQIVGDKEQRKTHQLCEIVTAPTSKSTDNPDVCLSSVYIDLSDTDVSFTVYYHDNLPKVMPHSGTYAPSCPMFHPANYPYTTWTPYTYPAYGMTPLYLPAPHVDIPRMLMVPPSELPKFTANTPPQRQWIPLAHPERSRPSAIFTVMCYNLLCDKYCTRQQYGYCPSWALNWEYRKKTIMEEIRLYSADIMSLQEVETEQFYNFFLPELKQDGYEGIFSPKSRARTMTEQERKHVDGCAIFFRTSKFTLVKEHLIEFNQLAMANAEGSDDMLNRVMTKDNIGIAAVLQTKDAVYENSSNLSSNDTSLSQTLLIATAHIHWDPEFCDVKLIQTMMLIRELKMIIESYSSSVKSSSQPHDCNDIPLIFCGDLNSQPDSGVIEFLDKGRVSANHEDFKEKGYETYLQSFSCDNSVDFLSHNFRLSRAYDTTIMQHTNYTYDFKGIIDYIFYSRDTMRCLGVLGALEEEWLKQNKVIGCPHPHIPSDHFSLFVELELPHTLRGSASNTPSNKLR